MNTVFSPIKCLLLGILLAGGAVAGAQTGVLPHVDIRSAANPGFKVEAAAVQCSMISPAPELGTAIRNVAVYTFEPAPDKVYAVTPVKDSDPLQGVSTLDLLQMVRHIQNLEPFTEPWQWMAADVDRDNTITYHDVRQLRQLLLDPFSELTDNQSWRFYDAGHAFSVSLPLEEPIAESITGRLSTATEIFRFYAVKIGDVNGSATRPDASQPESAQASLLALPDRLLSPGEEIHLALSVSDADVLWGLQGALRFDPDAIRIENVVPGNLLGMSQDGIALQGQTVTFSWYDAFPQRFTEETMVLTIRLTARKAVRLQDAVALAPALLQPEVYDAQGQVQALRMSLYEVPQSTVLNIAKKSLFLNATETPQPSSTAREPIETEEW